MHDPLTVAFEIRRPWPKRQRHALSRLTPRWSFQGCFWTLAGRIHLYWPGIVTVWHVEPDGRDSGEVCKRTGSWRWHVHHWRIQIIPLQDLRRWLLTRCAWCGGPSRKRSRVNVSHSWDGPRGPWWRGAPGLFHTDCSSAERAARSCTCESPILDHDGWGRCARCNLGYSYGRKDNHRAVMRLLKTLPAGQRPTPELMAQVREAGARVAQS